MASLQRGQRHIIEKLFEAFCNDGMDLLPRPQREILHKQPMIAPERGLSPTTLLE